MHKSLNCLTSLVLALPMAATAQSWLNLDSSPLDEPAPGSATQAIADMYFNESAQTTSSGSGPIRLVPSYVRPTPLDGVSLFYNADTGSYGRISDIGHGRTLILDNGPAWVSTEDLTSKNRNRGSLTLVNTHPDGSMSWRKILD